MDNVTTVTTKGQVTIPLEIRRSLGIKPGQKITFTQTSPNSASLSPLQDPIFKLNGILPSTKKFDKTKARQSYIQKVIDNKI